MRLMVDMLNIFLNYCMSRQLIMLHCYTIIHYNIIHPDTGVYIERKLSEGRIVRTARLGLTEPPPPR